MSKPFSIFSVNDSTDGSRHGICYTVITCFLPWLLRQHCDREIPLPPVKHVGNSGPSVAKKPRMDDISTSIIQKVNEHREEDKISKHALLCFSMLACLHHTEGLDYPRCGESVRTEMVTINSFSFFFVKADEKCRTSMNSSCNLIF